MERDAKQTVLLAIYTEYQKDIPDMENAIKAANLGLEKNVFKVALDKLENEGLINGVEFRRGGNTAIPLTALTTYIKITPIGIRYVEDKLNIDGASTGEQKVKGLLSRFTEWGWEQLKDVAARTLAEMAKN
ncbi:YjcQ family protein [Candidatus Formimonas warabiya]|uniref:DUF2513 domain-containing protein n=1 Tax=Formimonas warabiya TaxID=1761012 RepID=A0A3G1KNX0_FORW1|nr:YjcQ family protein [Candidatus Formimonas warabiya]ATW24173.1 hypothetical protein DCMF_04685 [Candidatus Formimonas warabiya]